MAGGRGKPKKEPKQQKIQEPEPQEETSEEEQENESGIIESNVDMSIGETEDIEQDPEEMETESEEEPMEPPKTVVIKTDKKVAGRKKKVQKVLEESKKKSKNDGKNKNSIVFSRYIHQVLNQVHPERTISSKAMNIMNNFVCDMFERIANESSSLTKLGKNLTMSSREIQTSVRLLLPGELANHAMSEGAKAVKLYSISKAKDKK
ncbi:unnamed protein product [Chironomus riparius]|uniref:Core Histone H2A/H2B/H3 domain-containing protein n=1 Tax=Chironomus riparius TaxID=315576 RepID=A0A9N9RQG9_9DIPT|nr:unnamed protein product [Chironomus riparius]